MRSVEALRAASTSRGGKNLRFIRHTARRNPSAAHPRGIYPHPSGESEILAGADEAEVDKGS